jgi:hypothetical protein
VRYRDKENVGVRLLLAVALFITPHSFCNAYQNGATPLSASKVMKGDMELYSKLSHDITQVIEEKHLL